MHVDGHFNCHVVDWRNFPLNWFGGNFCSQGKQICHGATKGFDGEEELNWGEELIVDVKEGSQKLWKHIKHQLITIK